jgi:hypothetical protein
MTLIRLRAGATARLAVAALGVALVPLVASPAHAQASRTWVSGVGDDANPCSRTAPCKTFAGAISKTAVGGVINALDPAGYGAVTITKSITIDATGTNASVLNSGTNGIIINAPGDADVTLRGLDVSGGLSGQVEGTCGGLTGIRILAARSVRLDDVRISGQQTAIETPLGGSSTDLFVDIAMTDVRVTDNCQYGVNLNPSAGHPTRVSIADSHVTQSNTAIRAGAGAEAWATSTLFDLNNTGVQLAGGRVHAGCGTQAVGNASNGAFSDYACGATVVAPQTVTVAATYCRVPKLAGRTLKQATAALKSARCSVGKVTKRKAKKAKRHKVVAQGIPAGTDVRVGTRVRLVIGR